MADIVGWCEQLPQFHLEGLREIAYARRSGLYYPSLDQPSSTSGHAEYVQSERRIRFYDIGESALFRHVLFHEIGHHVFFLVIGSCVKKQWVTRIYPHSSCATRYGTTNATEDFAECYALYAQGGVMLKRFPEKYAYMHDQVFSGDPATLKEKAGISA